MNMPRLNYGKGFTQQDIIERLQAIRPNHGGYRKAQDAIEVVKTLRQTVTLRDELIVQLQHRISQLEAQLQSRQAA